MPKNLAYAQNPNLATILDFIAGKRHLSDDLPGRLTRRTGGGNGDYVTQAARRRSDYDDDARNPRTSRNRRARP